VLGWPGQWAAKFTRDRDKGLHVQAGQELTHFKLLPGEEVRGPLAVVQFLERRLAAFAEHLAALMKAHNMPRKNGELPAPLLAAGSCPFFGPYITTQNRTRTSSSIATARRR